MALALVQARAQEEPPLTVVKVQALFHYLDSAKSNFESLAVGILNGVNALASMVIYGIVIYVFCMNVRFMLWILMALLDLAAGNHVFEVLTHFIQGLNKRLLPALPGLNGLLGLLVGFSIMLGWLNIATNISINRRVSTRINPYQMGAIFSHSPKLIGALPKVKYGSLRICSDDVNRKDSSSSSCAICLECFGEEDAVRILPNCRHYFHTSCIDCWLLPACTVNNSACPLCRATVIGLHS